MRRLRTRGQLVQHFQTLAFALGLDAMTEHEFQPRLVHAWIKLESSALKRLVDGPSSKDFRYFGDIALRIAAIHAQRMEFEKFASVVFVQPARALALIGPRARRIAPS